MAAFSMTRSDFGKVTIARKVTITDEDMAALLAERREAFGKQTDADSKTPRDMTDDEVTIRIFDTVLRSLVDQASANIRERAAQAAASKVEPIKATVENDDAVR